MLPQHQRLFRLLIKRLASSSCALKLTKGVHVQEILAFLLQGLVGEAERHLDAMKTLC